MNHVRTIEMVWTAHGKIGWHVEGHKRNGSNHAEPGERILLHVLPDDGYYLKEAWYGSGGDYLTNHTLIEDFAFTMPDCDIKIGGWFVPKEAESQ